MRKLSSELANAQASFVAENNAKQMMIDQLKQQLDEAQNLASEKEKQIEDLRHSLKNICFFFIFKSRIFLEFCEICWRICLNLRILFLCLCLSRKLENIENSGRNRNIVSHSVATWRTRQVLRAN